MFKFILGVVTAAIAYYVVTNHSDWVRRGVETAREQISVAARNISSATTSDRASHDYEPARDTTAINPRRAHGLAGDMRDLSYDQLWAVMDDSDFDRRAAASLVLLRRADIPATSEGIAVIKERFFRSGKTDDLKTGFSYLGLLAHHGVPDEQVVVQAQRFIERYPRHAACDYAVWALGELGSEELVPYFFQIVENEQKYGAAARERAFCCLVQCGRYSAARRLKMVPQLIEVHDNSGDSQTRQWSIQALAHCAPGVRARTIDDWKRWWARR